MDSQIMVGIVVVQLLRYTRHIVTYCTGILLTQNQTPLQIGLVALI